ATDRGSDGAIGRGRANRLSDFCVRRQPAGRHAQQGVPYLELKVRAAQVERERRPITVGREHGAGKLRRRILVALQRGGGPARTDVCERFVVVLADEGEVAEAARARSEEGVAVGRWMNAPAQLQALSGTLYLTGRNRLDRDHEIVEATASGQPEVVCGREHRPVLAQQPERVPRVQELQEPLRRHACPSLEEPLRV